MLRQCCCCAIIVLFYVFTAFLQFNSIDAGCAGSKHTEEEEPLERTINRREWSKYCGTRAPNNENGCNRHPIQPCIPMGNQCKAATINRATYLKHNEIWVEFCQNIDRNECVQTTIMPCFWHTNTSGESACIAKPSDRIFVRVPQA